VPTAWDYVFIFIFEHFQGVKMFGFKNNFVISAFSLIIFGKISAERGI